MSLISDSYVSFVNLDHRTDRLARMQESLDKVGLKAERTPGILPDKFDAADPRHAVMRKRTHGAIGCYEAQLQIMREACELGKHAFVMEDDLVFCSDFNKRMGYVDNWRCCNLDDVIEIERPWDVIWLGGTFHVGGKGPYWHTNTIGRDAEITDDPRMIRTYGSFCTYAYIINKNSLNEIIKQLEAIMPISMGIDWSFIQLSPNLLTYAFVPGMIKQYDNQSDQVPGKKDNITKFSNFSKLNGTIENSAYWWQDKMEDFNPLTFNWAEAGV
jgi:GR25 family glycosyltransferase involved in LPS biosynthesis